MDVDGDLGRIESLGLNCELGFALTALGNDRPGLLRWGLAPPVTVAALIEADFANLYEPETMVPCQLNMVSDPRYNIAFHTNLTCEQIDGSWCFVEKDAARRQRILAAERSLVLAQAAAFQARFRTPNTLYVIVVREPTLPEATSEILSAIKSRSGHTPFSMLEVRLAEAGAASTQVENVSEHLYRGYLDFFAPHERANEIDVQGWTRVLTQALHETGV